MRLTRHGHACVALTAGDRTLVIDPGTFTSPEALTKADAVLVTHEHEDHADVAKLTAARFANPSLTVHTHAALARSLDAVAVAPDETFTAAGFTVQAVGGLHAEIIDGLPGCPNLGYIVNGLYHPGDALFVPRTPVETLLVPASGPWLKLREAIEFVRAIAPSRAFPIHDANLSPAGEDNFDGWLEREKSTTYTRIPIGHSVDL